MIQMLNYASDKIHRRDPNEKNISSNSLCMHDAGALRRMRRVGKHPAAGRSFRPEAPATPADENALPEQYDLIMTFGAETGSVYAMGIQIGEYINSIAPDITCTVKVGAAASNLALLSTGETVIAHSQSDTIHEAIVGEGNFTEPVTGIYGVASVMESVLHVAVPADAP